MTSVIERFQEAQDALVIQAADFSLETVASMIDSGAVDIRPQFQRRERWNVEKQSLLIESFLLNVPVPPVYLSEDDYGFYSVIDGKQRMTAIHDFLRGSLVLKSLESFPELNGARFHDLPGALRNALSVRPYIRAVTLLKQSDPDIKYEVFHRLNSGGESLNPQEIRNVFYRGPLNDLLYELAESPFLHHQMKIRDDRSPAYRSMDDVELVLRFFTIRDSWVNPSPDLKRSMDRFMQSNREPSARQLTTFADDFKQTIDVAEDVFGDHAFQRWDVQKGWRDQLLNGVYDAQMVALSALSRTHWPSASVRAARDGMRRLFENPDFDQASRIGTNTPSNVVFRIAQVRDMLAAID